MKASPPKSRARCSAFLALAASPVAASAATATFEIRGYVPVRCSSPLLDASRLSASDGMVLLGSDGTCNSQDAVTLNIRTVALRQDAAQETGIKAQERAEAGASAGRAETPRIVSVDVSL